MVDFYFEVCYNDCVVINSYSLVYAIYTSNPYRKVSTTTAERLLSLRINSAKQQNVYNALNAANPKGRAKLIYYTYNNNIVRGYLSYHIYE